MKKCRRFISLLLCAALLLSASGLCCLAASPYKTPFENSAFFEKGDYAIHYRVFPNEGEKKGNILFIHGFGLSTASFDGMIPYFTKEGYFCVSVDLPDMGYSTRETVKTNIIPREQLLYELMGSLSDEKWILAGHSLGGGVSVNIASEHPEKVEAMLLFCPQSVESGFGSSASVSLLTGMLFDAVLAVGSRCKLLMTAVMFAAMQDNDFAKSYDVRLISDPLKIKGTGMGISVMSANAKCIDYEKVKAVGAPVLVVRGGIDNVARADNIDRLEQALPNETTLTIPDAGHMMICTRAGQLSSLSCDFLENNK